MNITQLLTRRYNHFQNTAQPIIYEWEDVISKELNVPIVDFPIAYRYTNYLGLNTTLFGPHKNTFRFVTNACNNDQPTNSKYIVPCIIDFYEREDHLAEFYRKHSKNKIVLLSSPFDYQYLKDRNCPLNINLFPYSLSDKYAITGKSNNKKYDIVLTGRQDPLLYSFFIEYIKKYPSVTYVKRGNDLNNDSSKTKDYYVNCKECIGSINSRDDFMKLQSQGRVTLYGVQGYDERTAGFFHMTPHFLEIIACQCHVIAHYPTDRNGIDAQYYEFGKFSPSIATFEEFEFAMNKALHTDIDIEMYSSYLRQHYTSRRVKQLQELLKNL